MVKIKPNINNGLSKVSSADCFQIRSVSKDRLTKKIGEVSESTMNEIRIGLSKTLSIFNK